MPSLPPSVLAGDKAPAFDLPSSTGGTVSLKSLTTKGVAVVFFYPRADTPGCTTEACAFRDASADYAKLGVAVAGMSPDPINAVQKFADKFDLKFPLLADEDHSVAEAYGVWQEKSMYGKKYLGVARMTFVIGQNGKVLHVFENVKPLGHDAEVLKWIRENA